MNPYCRISSAMHAIAMNLQNLRIITALIMAHLPCLRLCLIIYNLLPTRPAHRYAHNNIHNILSSFNSVRPQEPGPQKSSAQLGPTPQNLRARQVF
jgi:hypothetical protein